MGVGESGVRSGETLEEMSRRCGMSGERAVTAALKRIRKRIKKEAKLRGVYEELKS